MWTGLIALLGDSPPFPFLRLLLRQGEVHSMYKGDIFQGLPRTISIIRCVRESGLQPSLLSSKDAARNCRPTSVLQLAEQQQNNFVVIPLVQNKMLPIHTTYHKNLHEM